MRQNGGPTAFDGWQSTPRGVPAYSKSSSSPFTEKPMWVGWVCTPSRASSFVKFGYVRSFMTMKPVSIQCVSCSVSTRTVFVWPPSRLSASNSVTSWVGCSR